MLSDKGSIKSEDRETFVKELEISLTLSPLKKESSNYLDVNYNHASLTPMVKKVLKKRRHTKSRTSKRKHKRLTSKPNKTSTVKKVIRHNRIVSDTRITYLNGVKYISAYTKSGLQVWDNDFIHPLKSDEIQPVLITMGDIQQ